MYLSNLKPSGHCGCLMGSPDLHSGHPAYRLARIYLYDALHHVQSDRHVGLKLNPGYRSIEEGGG